MKIRSRETVYKSGDLSLVIVWTSLIFHYFPLPYLFLFLSLLFHPSVRMVLENGRFLSMRVCARVYVALFRL